MLSEYRLRVEAWMVMKDQAMWEGFPADIYSQVGLVEGGGVY